MQNQNQNPLVSLSQGLSFYQSFSTLVAVLEKRIENVSMKSHSYGITFVRNNVEPILSICNIEDLNVTDSELEERYLVQFYQAGIPTWCDSYIGFCQETFDDIISVVKKDYPELNYPTSAELPEVKSNFLGDLPINQYTETINPKINNE